MLEAQGIATSQPPTQGDLVLFSVPVSASFCRVRSPGLWWEGLGSDSSGSLNFSFLCLGWCCPLDGESKSWDSHGESSRT